MLSSNSKPVCAHLLALVFGVLMTSAASHAAPIDVADIVTVGNSEWAQPDLFSGITIGDVYQVCSTDCGNGTVNGYDMLGWRLAGFADVSNLFAQYNTPTGEVFTEEFVSAPASAFVHAMGSATLAAVFNDFRANVFRDPGQGSLEGLTSVRFGRYGNFYGGAAFTTGYTSEISGELQDLFLPAGFFGSSESTAVSGVWFVRDAAAVPLPATPALLGAGLLLLLARRVRA